MPDRANFRVGERDVPEPSAGQLLVRVIYLSMDPSMRSYVHNVASFWPRVPPGEPMQGRGLAQVVTSKHADFAPGDYVYGPVGWREWSVIDGAAVDFRPDPDLCPLRAWMGPLGTTGVTAWLGLFEIARPIAGEAVLVTTAAGAVGSVVVRLAKLRGARVVAVAGSDDKTAYCVDRLGADTAINYRTVGDLNAAVAEACPQGIDVFFDNVGGDQLDAGLRAMRVGGRVVICGTISQPNAPEPPQGPRVERSILTKRLSVRGILLNDFTHLHDQARRELAHWINAGALQIEEDVLDGLENAPIGLERVLRGQNIGKQIVQVGPEQTA